MMEMEADRIRDLSFDPKMIESERGVVYSERRNSEDSSFGALYELLKAAAFMAHPYHWPVLGWPSDIESWTMDDLQTHFRMGYAPNNCVMVAVGDVKADEVIALAKKYLEPIPRHDPPPPVRTIEPEQKGERRVVLNKPAQLPMQMIAYHIPRTDSPEHYAIELLGNVLAEGRSSRLYRRLVDRDQLAIGVSQFSEFSLDPGLMVFSVQPKGGVDPARSEQALVEEIERVRTGGISAEELQKAKNQWLADFYREMSTISGKANQLGEYEVFLGDYRKLLSAGRELGKVTAEEVRNAAQRYLGPKNKTVATLIPEKPEASQ
jgi:zinc protease